MSSRASAANNEILERMKKREHKENLEKRKSKLKKLFEEENCSHQIELMVSNRHTYKATTEVLEEAEEHRKQALAQNSTQLKYDLEKQIKELHLKQTKSDKLRHQEDEESCRLQEIEEIEHRQKLKEKHRKDCEVALENMKQHKLNLQCKATEARENLEYEKQLIETSLEADITDQIENQHKKQELKQTIDKFLKSVGDQHELEHRRQKHCDFLFDSETAATHEKQHRIWLQEQNSHEHLQADILATNKEQIKEHLQKNKENQLKLLEEREDMLRKVEEYEQDIKDNIEEARVKREKWKCEIEEDLRERKARKEEDKRLK